jgi:hypothetical protein
MSPPIVVSLVTDRSFIWPGRLIPISQTGMHPDINKASLRCFVLLLVIPGGVLDR